MKVIAQPQELTGGGRAVCAAIGVFDGVHRGHQAVIGQAVAEARAKDGLALAITFDRHPQSIVAPQRAPLLIQPLARKLERIAALGVDAALVYHFDERFSRQPAEEFARHLASGLVQLHSLSVGANFTFGHQRGGNVALLKQLGSSLGFSVRDAVPVIHAGEIISSTRIRQAIRAGDLAGVGAMLGRPYAVSGRVETGDQLGRKLGFPTANLAVSGLVLPPAGVYAARVALAGTNHPAVLNIGVRPTLREAAPALRCEAHLLDWSDDLYGRDLEVTCVGRLRDEQKFASLDELKAQITADIQQARAVLVDHPA
jgi:riboflavin kinase/FMN adenylyltransferase